MPWPFLRRCLGQEPLTWLSGALAMVVAGNAAASLAPLALKHLVDGVGRSEKAAIVSITAYGAALLLQRICEQMQAYAFGRGEILLTSRLHALAFDHLLRLPLAEHLGRRSGGLAQSINEGVLGLRLILTHVVVTIMPVLVQLTVCAAVLATQLGTGPTLVIAGAIAAYGLVFALSAQRLYGPMQSASRGALDAAATLHDGLMNVEALKAFTAEAAYGQRYRAALAGTHKQWRRLLARRLEGGMAASLVFVATVVASLVLVAGDVARGALSAGDLVLISAYLLQIVRPIEMLGFAARDLGQGRAYLAALTNLLETPPEPDLRRPGPKSVGGLSLAFEHVDLALAPDRVGLKDVNLEVRPGETLALVGPSGAGKSTIVRLTLGFYRPDRGVVRVDGQCVTEVGLAALRSQIALVSQDTILMNDTLRANIALGGSAPESELLRAAHGARLTGLIARLPEGLDTQVGERGLKLSGGERQRVAIARALARRARLLVLDEATAALDQETEQALWRTFAEQAAGASKLIVTHRLAVAQRADRIVVLEAGQVVETGTHDDLIARRGLYWRLWRRQTGGQALATRA